MAPLWSTRSSSIVIATAAVALLLSGTSDASKSSGGGSFFKNLSGGSSATVPVDKRLTEDTMAVNLKNMQYAVRGQVVIAADRITQDIADGNTDSYPFDHIIYTNIGNPHSVGQKALTWPRRVLALADLPDDAGIDHPEVSKMFPSDAVDRAREIKKGLGGVGTGAYSHSQGAKCFRDDVAKFITNRDGGVTSDPDLIFMTNGASSGINMLLTALIKDDKCGVMIPIPQYPIYSATIGLLGGQQVGYYLDEKNGWDTNMKELERSLKDAQDKGIVVNSFVLINPGNPTGAILSRKALKDIVKFCAKHKLVLLADEVYQENIYDDNAEFISCKRVVNELGFIEDGSIELASFHSTSKGLYGECGRRGGYMELVGFDPKVKDHLYKLASSGLCSGLPGQIMTSLMVRGPPKDGPSYQSHSAEKDAILGSLKRRSRIVSKGLDAIDGFSCQTAQGAMYCFPSVEIPDKAAEEATRQGLSPDTVYAISLLESTGICVVPASGFGQEKGRFGFRTTFLPSEEEMERAVGLFKQHHEDFCKRYE